MSITACPRCGAATYRSQGGNDICTKCGHKLGFFDKIWSRWRHPNVEPRQQQPVPSEAEDLDELLTLAPDPRRTYLLQVLLTLPPEKAIWLVKAALARPSDFPPVEFQFGDGTQAMRLDHRDYTEADIRWAESTFEVAQSAEAKARSGQYADAIPVLKRALHMSPGHDLLLLTLGVCYAELKEFRTAINILERAHKLYPGNGRIHDNLEAVIRAARQ